MGKSTISMAIFNSYVKLPEGRSWESQILGLVPVIVLTRHQKMKTLCLCCMLSPGLDLSQDGLSQKSAPKPGDTKVNILSLITDLLKFGAFEPLKTNPAAFWVAMPGVVLGYVSSFVAIPFPNLCCSTQVQYLYWWTHPFLLLVSPCLANLSSDWFEEICHRIPELLPQNVTFLGQITQRLMLHFPC